MMRLFVISDIHIRDPEDSFYTALIDLLNHKLKKGDTFVFAGDIFDLYVGNKKIFYDRYLLFFKALQKASLQGVNFHYIEGNHDFQMSSVFKKFAPLYYHSREVHLELLDKKFFIAHGDLVNKKDYGYLFLRTVLRSIPLRLFIHFIPGKWVDSIGSKSSQASRTNHSHIPTLDELKPLRKIYRNFSAEKITKGYDYVVLGHCHDADEISFQVGDHMGFYMNVGYPRVHNCYLIWDSKTQTMKRENLI